MVIKESIRDAYPVTLDVPFQKGPCSQLYVGVTGNITVQFAGGTVATFLNVPVGTFRVEAVQVNSAGTTASSLVAGYY